MMEAALRTALIGAAPVSGLVGARVYPLKRDQKAGLPAITYQRISGAPLRSHDGPAQLCQARVQIDCWADTYSAAKGLARAVCAAVDAAGSATGVIRTAIRDSERDLSELEGDLARISIDFTIWHMEA